MAYEELHHGAEMLGFWLGERVLVYLTTHGYVRRVSRPPTAAYSAGVVGE